MGQPIQNGGSMEVVIVRVCFGRSPRAIVIVAMVSCAPAVVYADDTARARSDEGGTKAQSGIHGILAVGVAAEPEFEGAAEYLPIPQAYAHITAFGLGLEIEGPEARLNLRPHAAFQFGPAVEYRMGRDDVANDVIDRLKVIDGAFEAGGFVTYQFKSLMTQSDVFEISAELMADVSGVHEGVIGKVRAGYWIAPRERLRVGIETEVGFATDDYMNTYFGVSEAGSARSGLAAYTAEGGVKDIGVQATMTYQLTERWGLVGRASYTRLLGDAADSPIVKDEGSADQFRGGVGLSFKF